MGGALGVTLGSPKPGPLMPPGTKQPQSRLGLRAGCDQECLSWSVLSPPARCHLLHPTLGAPSDLSFPSVCVLSGCDFRVCGISCCGLGLTCILCKRPPHPAPAYCGVGTGGTFTFRACGLQTRRRLGHRRTDMVLVSEP